MHVAEQLRGMCELRCPDLLTHALANPNSCPTPDCVADDSSPCSGTDALAGSSTLCAANRHTSSATDRSAHTAPHEDSYRIAHTTTETSPDETPHPLTHASTVYAREVATSGALAAPFTYTNTTAIVRITHCPARILASDIHAHSIAK